MKATEDIIQRADHLIRLNDDQRHTRHIVRAILNGGTEAARVLLGDDSEHLPAANLVHSALERLAQKTQDPPSLKVDPPAKDDGERARRRAETRERCVEQWDSWDRLRLMIPQAARWLAGYGFAVFVNKVGTSPWGDPYPKLELRDPFACSPAPWGISQQPEDLVFQRRVPENVLRERYGLSRNELRPNSMALGGAVLLDKRGSRWENPHDNGVPVWEYFDSTGSYLVLPETGRVLDYVPAPEGVKPFRVMKRFSFDQLQGQYDHTIGLMQMAARLNVLAFIATSDAVFAPTNIYGEITSGEYEKGRHSVNEFTPGTRVERPSDPAQFQAFTQIDRIERQLRLTGGYPVTDDAQSPNSFVTGQGLQELTAASDNMVREYQTILGYGMEDVDEMRLRWAEAAWPNDEVKTDDGDKYVAGKVIRGDYRTRRVYGVMAGLDSSAKLVGMLQLNQAGWLDKVTGMENLDGLDNIPRTLERIRQEQITNLLYQILPQMATGQAPVDDRVLRFLVAQMPEGEERRLMEDVFFPEEEDIAAPVPQQPAALAAPGDDVTTILERLSATGQTEAGLQTVRTVA